MEDRKHKRRGLPRSGLSEPQEVDASHRYGNRFLLNRCGHLVADSIDRPHQARMEFEGGKIFQRHELFDFDV